MGDKSIIRVQHDASNPFVMVNKSVFQDTNLSWEAKGLMGYLLSRPDDWQVRVTDLVGRSTNGRDSVYKCLLELRIFGYVERTNKREEGRIEKVIYTVWETSRGIDQELYKKEEEKRERARLRRAAKANAPLPENPEVVKTPLPENPEVVKTGSPLPDFPDRAKPDRAKPPLLIKKEITKKESTNIQHDHDHDGDVNELPPEVYRKATRYLVEAALGFPNINVRVFADLARQYDRAYMLRQADWLNMNISQITNVAGAFVKAVEKDWEGSRFIPPTYNDDRTQQRPQATQGPVRDERYSAFYKLFPDHPGGVLV